jgi:type IV pilus assembly protein PilC
MEFLYKAIDGHGTEIEGRLEAADRFAVAKELRTRNQTPVSVREVIEKNGLSVQFARMFAHIGLHEKIVFVHNLSGMLAAGLPLYRALEVERKQTKNPALKNILDGLLATINSGSTLSTGLAKYPDTFPTLVVSMVRAGEESGNLAPALKEIGANMEKTYALNRKVKGALMYPTIIFCAIILIGILMLVFVVPTLTKIFKDFGTALPRSTQIVISISDAVSKHPSLFFFSIAAVVLGLIIFVKSKVMRRTNDNLALVLPGVSTIVKEVNAARTARTLSSLLTSGVEMTRALEITKDVLQNVFYKDVLDLANAAVQRGELLSSVFKSKPQLYPVMVGEMVAVGEETGTLSQMLAEVATYYEEEVDAQTKNLSTIIEPVLMVLIGGAVGFFAISMISPMYGLVNSLAS